MDKRKIAQIIKESTRAGLVDAIRARLHTAQHSAERAPYENFKKFDEEIANARTALDEAEQLYGEVKAL